MLLAADSRDHLAKQGQAWRLLSSLWPAESIAAGLVTCFLLYRFRTFERQMGSSRFSMFVLFCTIWAMGTRAAIVFGGGPLTRSGLVSGPMELVFALFVYFYRECSTDRPLDVWLILRTLAQPASPHIDGPA